MENGGEVDALINIILKTKAEVAEAYLAMFLKWIPQSTKLGTSYLETYLSEKLPSYFFELVKSSNKKIKKGECSHSLNQK